MVAGCALHTVAAPTSRGIDAGGANNFQFPFRSRQRNDSLQPREAFKWWSNAAPLVNRASDSAVGAATETSNGPRAIGGAGAGNGYDRTNFRHPFPLASALASERGAAKHVSAPPAVHSGRMPSTSAGEIAGTVADTASGVTAREGVPGSGGSPFPKVIFAADHGSEAGDDIEDGIGATAASHRRRQLLAYVYESTSSKDRGRIISFGFVRQRVNHRFFFLPLKLAFFFPPKEKHTCLVPV